MKHGRVYYDRAFSLVVAYVSAYAVSLHTGRRIARIRPD